MPSISSRAAAELIERLSGPAGVPAQVAQLALTQDPTLPQVEPSQIVNQQIAADLAEKTAGASYPALYVYCERLENTLREKFRTFSGRAHLAIEVRMTHDRLESLTRQLELFAGAVTAVLDSSRGTWQAGYFYTGGYEVQFGPVKRGGKNFIQAAKVSLAVEVSL